MKSRAYRILILLGDGPLHGWSIVKELQAQAGDGVRILPGSLYRTLNSMMEEGLIEEAPDQATSGDEARRRYLQVTALGIEEARAETRRLEELLEAAHSKPALFPEGAKA